VNGFVCIDKPAGMTSFAVVKTLRRLLKVKKAGHSGTLDPAATGLLVVALENATRLFPFLPVSPKKYLFTVAFGAETDSLDASGEVVEDGGRIPSEEEINAITARFIGKSAQVPPKFSSVKVGGVRAYKRARRREGFEMKPREIEVFSLEQTRYDPLRGEAGFAITCETGTYIRSIARDMARALGTLGYASSVRRTAVGRFTLDQARALDAGPASIRDAVIPVGDAFEGCPGVTLTDLQKQAVSHGRSVMLRVDNAGAGNVVAFDRDGEVAAVLAGSGPNTYKPVRVFCAR